jgi:cytoskeleton protein RodZ
MLTVEQVASQLRLTPKQIQQLEAEDPNAFPSVVYSRAHLRGYARLIGLDENEVVSLFNDSIGGDEKDQKRFISRTTQGLAPYRPEKNKVNRGRGLVYALFILLLGGVGAAGWFYYDAYQAKELQKKEAAEQAILAEQQRLAAEEQKRAEELRRIEAEKKEAARQKQLAEEAARIAAEKKEQETRLQQVEAVANEQGLLEAALPKNGGEAAKVVIEIPQGAGRSWVGVYTSDGKFFLNKTLDAGTKEEFDAKLPLRFQFGNGRAVNVTVDGTVIDFKTANNKAGSRPFVIRAK